MFEFSALNTGPLMHTRFISPAIAICLKNCGLCVRYALVSKYLISKTPAPPSVAAPARYEGWIHLNLCFLIYSANRNDTSLCNSIIACCAEARREMTRLSSRLFRLTLTRPSFSALPSSSIAIFPLYRQLLWRFGDHEDLLHM